MSTLKEPHTVWLRPWKDDAVSEAHADLVRETFNTVISGENTADGLIAKWAEDRAGFWSIMDGADFAGITSVGPSAEHPEFFVTGTFLLPQHRGRGINTTVKLATVKAFSKMEVPLAAHASSWNGRSRAAMAKLFPTVEPTTHYHNDEERLWYDLSGIPWTPPTQAEQPVYLHLMKLRNVYRTIRRQAVKNDRWWETYVRTL